LTGNTTAVVVAGNTIGGGLSCSGNDPAPTDAGRPNIAHGSASGQCSAMA
jgi:hexosaminidase